MRLRSALLAVAGLATVARGYWMGDIPHQGLSPYAPNAQSYKTFRNVKDYGAKGDGVSDDTAAINAAIHDGGRCGQGCASSTVTPAVVYFPSGTYLISGSLFPDYITQMIGDAADPPTLKAASNFAGFGLIDGDPYYTQDPNWLTTTVFYRQVRNFVLDTTSIPPRTPATGMHWPTSQATSIQNVVFNMPKGNGSVHVGLFVESGSGGFMSDLTFNGGATGASVGNQQFTMRNFKFNDCGTAIIQLWDWGWTWMGIEINNCGVGLDMSAGGSSNLATGSIAFIDSTISNTPVGVKTAYSSNSNPPTANSLVIENVKLNNVPVAVQGVNGTVLSGSSSSTTITAWGEGHKYDPNGPTQFQGTLTQLNRPASLLDGDRYYVRSKPQYESLSASDIVSVRTAGATGDGKTDDTSAFQSAIDDAVGSGKLLYIDYGIYKVTKTISIPPGAKIVGETYPIIMSSGDFFADMSNPKPVIQVGSTSGQSGEVELSDFIVSTQGAQAGATLIEWNLNSAGTPSGMWDVHTRIGGFAGSNQQVAECLKQPGSSAVNPDCIVAFMSMHVTEGASNLYMENCWLWTADHDLDDPANQNTQITVYAGRGLYVESTEGTFWFVGTGSEHHVLYQYQFANTKNVFASQFQTETPYYQPQPNALVPFPPVAELNDPDFQASCNGVSGTCASAWGLRIINSKDFYLYGVGLYSFFDNYSTACSTFAAGEDCQARIFSIESSSDINVFNLNTIGSQSMIDRDGKSLAWYNDNVNVFPSTIAVFYSG